MSNGSGATAIPTKQRPPQSVEFLFRPERDRAYVHFENAASHPFDATASVLQRRNAWWLGDAALLSYWDPGEAIRRFKAAGLEADLVQEGGTQAYLAWTDRFVIVAFRGTEADHWEDVWDDLQLRQERWDRPATQVHAGFRQAIERVWPRLKPRLDHLAGSRSVWFTGHSLGAGLATLAADRYAQTAGVCTFGGSRVGNRAFAQGFDARFAGRAVRYVNDQDIIPHLPTPIFFRFLYKHAGTLRHISTGGDISPRGPGLLEQIRRGIHGARRMLKAVAQLKLDDPPQGPKWILDHTLRCYTVDIWNDYAVHGD